MTTRELYSVELPNGRRLGFYDFDFTPGWAGTQRDPPESPKVSVLVAFWLDGEQPVALTPAELLGLHIDVGTYACLLARVEEIVDRRDALLIGERTRAKSDAATVAALAAAGYFRAAEACLADVRVAHEELRHLPVWRWYRARTLQARADLALAQADTQRQKGEERAEIARKLGGRVGTIS